LAAAGLRPFVDDAGNVVAALDGRSVSPGSVVVCAHLDTVFSAEVAHEIVRRGDILTAPGICDNARGLAALVAIARVLAALRIRPAVPVVLAATVGEEGAGDLLGARHLFTTSCPSASAAIALDGAGDSRIVTHAIGVRRLRIAIRGPGGHSWAASHHANPLHAAAALGAQVASMEMRRTPRSSATVTRLHGGEALNAIPQVATIDIELRAGDETALAEGVDELRRLVHGALDHENARRGRETPALTSTIDVVSQRPAGHVDPASPLLRHAWEATGVIGRTPESAIASTDANVPMHLGIAAIALGGGGQGGEAHTTSEWFTNAHGALGIARVVATLLATTGVA
jgi:acetylornithine deacetylase/succinyl-diaminopimelate desuccinylase-like protein